MDLVCVSFLGRNFTNRNVRLDKQGKNFVAIVFEDFIGKGSSMSFKNGFSVLNENNLLEISVIEQLKSVGTF